MIARDHRMETMSFADVLREMDIEFLVSGGDGILVEEAAKFLDCPHFLFLDVRTNEEHNHLAVPFALLIPVKEHPTGWLKCPGTSSSLPFA